MEYYRNESKQLVVVCNNKGCDERLLVSEMIETSLKAGQRFMCSCCFSCQTITSELQNYVKQTRCYT